MALFSHAALLSLILQTLFPLYGSFQLSPFKKNENINTISQATKMAGHSYPLPGGHQYWVFANGSNTIGQNGESGRRSQGR